MNNEVLEPENKKPLIEKAESSFCLNLCYYSFIVLALTVVVLISYLIVTHKLSGGALIMVQDKGNNYVFYLDFKKPLSDSREYRVVRLRNNLDAVLISDPKSTQSSASLSVGVGSFMDEVPGLAHFCEHMLFLGSRRFPDATLLEDHLQQYSGSNNAFTQRDKTTYFFSVNNQAFDKALNIFSSMFEEPLFAKDYTNKEIEAVNSEHEKNLNSDSWRSMQLLRSMSNPNHQNSKFSTGSLKTLQGASDLIGKLKTFYNKYYKSFNMKLAVVSDKSLDEIQSTVSKYFSDIKDVNNKTVLFGNLETEEKAYRKEDLGKISWYKKVSSGNTMSIIFLMDSIYDHYKSKPLDYISYLLNHKGEKSLYSFLRKRKLVNHMKSSVDSAFTTFTEYNIDIDLTEEGVKQVDFVIRLVFQFINMIKNSPIDLNIFDELKRLSQVKFKWMEKDDDSSNIVNNLSGNMFTYDYQYLLFGDYAYETYDELLIKKFMNFLDANNCIILIGTENDFENKQFLTSVELRKEEYYGTEYKMEGLGKDYIEILNSYPVPFETIENIDSTKIFKLRPKNKYISAMSEFAKDCNTSSRMCEKDEFNSKIEDYTPVSLHNQNNFKIYYKIDNSFKLPKLMTHIKIFHSSFVSTHLDFVYTYLLYSYLDYNFSFAFNNAREAGNSVSIYLREDAITIQVNAFSDLAEKISQDVANELFKFTPEKETFDQIVELTRENIKSSKSSAPSKKNFIIFKRMIRNNFSTYKDLLPFFKTDQIKFKDFQTFCDNFKTEMMMKLFIYGSTDKDEVDRIVNNYKKFLSVPKQDPSSLELRSNDHKKIDEMVTMQLKNDEKNQVNHAITNMYQIGIRDYQRSLYLSMIDKCLGKLFYYNLRTLQQLGYVVSAFYKKIDLITVRIN